jgi:putative transposase
MPCWYVIAERRPGQGFVLTAWVFLPGHWHAIFFPASLLTIALVMECIKVSSTFRINAARHEKRKLWQPRYFDQVLRTVKEYRAKADYIHQNPVEAGLVKRAEDCGAHMCRALRWPGSQSVRSI